MHNHIPTEQDWEGYQDDIDARYAYEYFFGKTIYELTEEFRQSVIERADELRFMPVRPFRYYIFALSHFIMEDNYLEGEADMTINSLFNLVLEKLNEYPENILPVMERLLPSLQFMADNVERYNISEEIYGSVPNRLQTILQRYRMLQH